MEGHPLEEQEAEETFDLALIASLEVDVVPYVADARVPDYIIIQLAKFLHQGSLLYQSSIEDTMVTDSLKLSSIDSADSATMNGSTMNDTVVPRERFAYWCLDLLFLICSDSEKGESGFSFLLPLDLFRILQTDEEALRRRVAALCLPTLLNRCRTTLLNYIADELIRGSYPFPRSAM